MVNYPMLPYHLLLEYGYSICVVTCKVDLRFVQSLEYSYLSFIQFKMYAPKILTNNHSPTFIIFYKYLIWLGSFIIFKIIINEVKRSPVPCFEIIIKAFTCKRLISLEIFTIFT